MEDKKIRYKQLLQELHMLAEEMVPMTANMPSKVVEYMIGRYGDTRVERANVVYLNAKNNIIVIEELPTGTVDHANIYPREIYRRALELDALSIILVHNHPSGELKPSGHDIRLTENISMGMKTLGMKLIDHIIIGNGTKYFSFIEDGLI